MFYSNSVPATKQLEKRKRKALPPGKDQAEPGGSKKSQVLCLLNIENLDTP